MNNSANELAAILCNYIVDNTHFSCSHIYNNRFYMHYRSKTIAITIVDMITIRLNCMWPMKYNCEEDIDLSHPNSMKILLETLHDMVENKIDK